MKILSFCGLFLISFSAIAQCDVSSGNCYSVSPSYDGYNVQGYNLNTGSIWNTNLKNNGDMDGWDSQGNYWQYNDNSGNYYNFGTGKSCYGKGYGRQCF
ncbi:hypothetical protein [Legionella feeleii]|uniref:Major outer membrane protein n=1 Tax=Legionella feeleii TaxID=453 RepID=A0A378IQG8_9GAMM|nr:hypothetical protein [Legionella feeleii]STX37477.1 Uncharacterised protein [Legionella feeleii]